MSEKVFDIRRYTPAQNLDVLKSLKKLKRTQASKQYVVTNDEQRYKVVYGVLFNGLSIKEVKQFFIARQLWLTGCNIALRK